MMGWREAREGNTDYQAIAPAYWAAIDRTIPELWAGGSSGLYACQVAQALCFRKAVLCGVPMTSDPRFFDPAPWAGSARYRQAWARHKDRLGFVRSMSGWTRDLLGEPDDLFMGQ